MLSTTAIRGLALLILAAAIYNVSFSSYDYYQVRNETPASTHTQLVLGNISAGVLIMLCVIGLYFVSGRP